MSSNGGYYLPQPSHWPLVGSLGLFLTLGGFAFALPVNRGDPMGSLMLTYIGLGVLTFMLYGWFGQVVGESGKGVYNDQVDRSFRMGMGWFIFSEVMFFAAFFGALYYIRAIILPEAQVLAPDLNFSWPFSGTDGLKHVGTEIPKEGLGTDKFASMGAGGIPMWNTIILLTSGVTLTIAHWGLKKNNNAQLVLWLAVTVALGILFLGLQLYEYGHAWNDLNLRFGDPKHAMDEAQIAKLALTDPEAAKAATKAIWGQGAGAYASTFYMLTGFHGFHVFVGATILLVLLFRSMKGHFTEEHHFAFEAGAWYWHFVDVVWLGLFIFVYFLV